MLVASHWFLHNEHQQGWKHQQQQIHVDQRGDQIISLIHGKKYEKNASNPNINSGIFVIFFLLCLTDSSFLISAVQTLVAQILNHNHYFSFDLTFLSLPFLPQFQTIPPSLLPTSFSINTSVCCLSRSHSMALQSTLVPLYG